MRRDFDPASIEVKFSPNPLEIVGDRRAAIVFCFGNCCLFGDQLGDSFTRLRHLLLGH
jgi:hypothetical protein